MLKAFCFKKMKKLEIIYCFHALEIRLCPVWIVNTLCLTSSVVLYCSTKYAGMWQNASICSLYLVCKIWDQCILANYISLSLSDSVERRDGTVCMWFSWVVKLCITCIAGWAKIRIVLGMEPRVPLSSLTPVLITAVTNSILLSLSHTHTVMRDEWMKAEE